MAPAFINTGISSNLVSTQISFHHSQNHLSSNYTIVHETYILLPIALGSKMGHTKIWFPK
jgi:hypothetical protein